MGYKIYANGGGGTVTVTPTPKPIICVCRGCWCIELQQQGDDPCSPPPGNYYCSRCDTSNDSPSCSIQGKKEIIYTGVLDFVQGAIQQTETYQVTFSDPNDVDQNLLRFVKAWTTGGSCFKKEGGSTLQIERKGNNSLSLRAKISGGSSGAKPEPLELSQDQNGNWAGVCQTTINVRVTDGCAYYTCKLNVTVKYPHAPKITHVVLGDINPFIYDWVRPYPVDSQPENRLIEDGKTFYVGSDVFDPAVFGDIQVIDPESPTRRLADPGQRFPVIRGYTQSDHNPFFISFYIRDENGNQKHYTNFSEFEPIIVSPYGKEISLKDIGFEGNRGLLESRVWGVRYDHRITKKIDFKTCITDPLVFMCIKGAMNFRAREYLLRLVYNIFVKKNAPSGTYRFKFKIKDFEGVPIEGYNKPINLQGKATTAGGAQWGFPGIFIDTQPPKITTDVQRGVRAPQSSVVSVG